jgi:hypothetical protein
MAARCWLPGIAAVAMAVASQVAIVHTQSREATGWKTPRTPDGQPDLQGIWTNATITPFERPASLSGKAFLTEEEAAALEAQAARRRVEADRLTPGEVGSYNQFWFDAGEKVLSTRQTSLVVDPPDGRVPLTRLAEQRRDRNFAHYGDSFEYMSLWDRCITRGVPGSMFPAGYNNAYQIVQVPGYLVIFHEMIHDARIIPVDERPPLPSQVRLWMGDSRGRWEDDTLVIETANFNDRGWIATSAATGRIKGVPHTEQLRVVERLRRTAPDTIMYSATIEDPEMYTRPWTVSFPLTADPAYRIYEYACHEGNYAMEGMLRGARAQEAAAAKKR